MCARLSSSTTAYSKPKVRHGMECALPSGVRDVHTKFLQRTAHVWTPPFGGSESLGRPWYDWRSWEVFARHMISENQTFSTMFGGDCRGGYITSSLALSPLLPYNTVRCLNSKTLVVRAHGVSLRFLLSKTSSHRTHVSSSPPREILHFKTDCEGAHILLWRLG
jgi:hypothetical protein